MKTGISIIAGLSFAVAAVIIIAFPYFAILVAIGYIYTRETLDEKDN